MSKKMPLWKIWPKYLAKIKNKQNWTRAENFDFSFLVIFDRKAYYTTYQSILLGKVVDQGKY